jgi:Ca2+-binding RTX toxin-like protein
MLTGGAGADSLYGASQYGGGAASGDNDTLDGEAGNDYLVGGFGSDTYLFGAGGGQDVINNDSDSWNGYADPDANKRDVLQFKSGVLASAVSAGRSSDNLILKINGTTDQVTIQNYFSQDGVSARGWAVDQVKFADGTAWALADVKAKVLVPTAGNDSLIGYATADTLSGGAGADTLQGGSGNDTYGLGRGGGSDTIAENDATAGNTDVALFGPDIAADQLWFRQVGSHLEVSVIGSTDKFTVSNWYSGSSYHVEQFKTANGKVLLDTQVQNLVQAMAGFTPPASGQTTLPASYQSSLNPIIAANWQ